MKYLFFTALIASFFLTSCGSAQFHISKAEKHTQKAIEKGAIFTSSTDTVTVSNITYDTTTVGDTVFISSIETVVKTVTEMGEIRYISKLDKRREFKLQKQLNRLTEKNKRLQARLDVKNQRYTEKTKRVSLRNEKKSRFDWKILPIIALLTINIYLWITRK